ncbi:prophage tail fiber N-terminal domain-containing protein [Aeromonas veronii]
MIRIFGTMTDPSGSPVPGAIIELRAINSTSEVLLGSTVNHKCDQQGAYSFQLAIGTYDAYAQNDRCGDMDYLGTARVSANSVDGDLHSILVDGGINITPPMLEGALAAAQRAESAAALTAADRVSTGQNAESAKADSAAAKTAKDEAISAASTAISARDSIVTDANDVRRLATQIADQAADVSSKHGDVAAKAAQVSAQADVVSTKHGEVVAKADQVSDDASATQSAKNISVAAADTATQKAASAATHDASAQDAATRAENAASVVVGAVLDGGECDLSTGAYPQPITVAGKKYSTIWYVAVAGSVSGVSFDVGDILRYTTAKEGYYFKVDAKDDVYSVNGEKGAVTITPEKIGAERVGVAQQLVGQHTAKQGAHSIGGVAGLEDVLTALTNRLEELDQWPQSGSNANGSWIKYRDGTMICTMSKGVTGLTGTAYGSVYGNSQTRIAYPKEFAGTPVVAPSSSIPPNITSWCTTSRPDNISAGVIIFSGTNISPVDKFNIELIAVGRWK